MADAKKLYRSEDNKLGAGVCGGIAEYFNLDPTLIRLAFLLLVVLTGFFPGVVAYIVMAIITPTESEVKNHGKKG